MKLIVCSFNNFGCAPAPSNFIFLKTIEADSVASPVTGVSKKLFSTEDQIQQL